jgi:hypothetical protein
VDLSRLDVLPRVSKTFARKYNLAPVFASRQVHEANTYPLKLATLYGSSLVGTGSGGMHPVVVSVFHSTRNEGLKY